MGLKILMFALGSRGDVQPYLALGAALVQAGHHVRLLTHEGYWHEVQALGLECWEVQGNVQEAMQDPALRKVLDSGNFLKINQMTSRLIEDLSLKWATTAVQASEGVDLLLAGIGGGNLAQAMAEKCQLPLLEAHLVPFVPTKAFPGVLLPPALAALGGGFNRFSHFLVQQAMWQAYRTADTQLRQKVLQLPAAPFFGPRPNRQHAKAPILHGISPQVLPRPADWPAHVHMTGYWFLETSKGWSPPAALKQFLSVGPPPLYVGFGSMGSQNPQATAELVLEALRQTGQRAVLLQGWGGLQPQDVPSSVYLAEALPHRWLFPQMRAVVHHGGAGTTAAGLQAGVPALVVPFFGDQAFWGHRLQQLGVAVAPLPRRTLTVSKLVHSLERLLEHENHTRQATELGQRIRQEQGTRRAVEHIEHHAKQLRLT